MRKLIILAGVICSIAANAQTFRHYITTDDARWTQGQDVKAQTKSNTKASLCDRDSDATDSDFPELGHYILMSRIGRLSVCLPVREQDEILHNSFSPDGELKFSIGRISMNANDYALSWYSCSDVHGDFDNKYFNIERDKLTIIPLYPCGDSVTIRI